MIAFLKTNLLYAFYALGAVFFFVAATGRIKWTMLFLIGLFPLVNVQQRLHAFPLGKDFADILLIALLIGWLVGKVSRNEKIFTPSGLNVILPLLMLYMFISLVKGSVYLQNIHLLEISDPRVQAWKNFCIFPILFFLTFNNITDKKWVWRTVAVMCLTMLLMDYYTLQQIKWFSSIVSRVKIKGTFVYLGPNEIAAFYTQYTVILISLYFAMKKGLKKFSLLGLIMMNIYCVMLLFSRAAYIALAVGLVLLFLFKDRKWLIPFLLVIAFWHTALPQKVIQRIEMTTNEYGELDASSTGRLLIWDRSLELFNKNPLVGVGYGVFYFLGFEKGDTHNIYLKILAEQGLLGFFIFLALVIILFIQGIRLHAAGDDPLSRALGFGFVVALVVMLVNNMFGDRWTYLPLSSNLWVFAALVARLRIIAREGEAPREAEPRKEKFKYVDV